MGLVTKNSMTKNSGHRKWAAAIVAASIFFVTACDNDDYTKGHGDDYKNMPGNDDTTTKASKKKDTIPTASAANKDGNDDSTIEKRKVQHKHD